jgi:hypothetical protein
VAYNTAFLREGKEGMILPTIDQTEGIWIARTGDQGYHAIQKYFPRKRELIVIIRQTASF